MSDVFQRYDSTGTGRILQNDLYKFMKQMHADNRQTTHTADPTWHLNQWPISTTQPSPLLSTLSLPPSPLVAALFPKDIVIQMSAQLDLVGYLDYETFRVMTFRFPMLFYPITRIQQAMRDRVITRQLFATLDVRTSDIYYQRTVGDRPPLYAMRKMRHYCRLLMYSVCWWRKMRMAEVEERIERRERIRREKEEVKRRRQGGVGGELWEEKRAEMEFMRARKRTRLLVRQRQLAAAGEPLQSDEEEEDDEEDVPSNVRRKYFGTDMKREDDPEKIDAIVRRIKEVVHSVSSVVHHERSQVSLWLVACVSCWLPPSSCVCMCVCVCARVCRRCPMSTTATRTAKKTSTTNTTSLHSSCLATRYRLYHSPCVLLVLPCRCAASRIGRLTSMRMHTSNESYK